MKSDKSWQQLGCVLEQLEKLKAAIELIATDGDTNITDLKAQSPVVDECENNLDLIVKRAEEFREQSLGVLRRDLEPIFRDRYAEAVRDLNTALSTAHLERAPDRSTSTKQAPSLEKPCKTGGIHFS